MINWDEAVSIVLVVAMRKSICRLQEIEGVAMDFLSVIVSRFDSPASSFSGLCRFDSPASSLSYMLKHFYGTGFGDTKSCEGYG